ncbi:hypothetical protein FDP41_008611 [Naegleria fowleri]|uniref:UBC core domain-containing protein n=1 Tax=Naegleria fowleri TaxID=5763 RepID=A0A6A5B5H7_NAEFO|nr:uncharacterized protein FDP41_008611 [Naegleria fowleri]KAF0973107.1 hypothetical protein FDP41_008611 [Naegleria fowleri]CAG4707820.1 unnamed protein product [Naegleria fowleri]
MFSPKRLELYREKLMLEPPSLMKAILIDDDEPQPQQSSFGISEVEYFEKCSIGNEQELLLGEGGNHHHRQSLFHCGFISKRMAADFDNLDEGWKKRLTLCCREHKNGCSDTKFFIMTGSSSAKELLSHQVYDTLLYRVFDSAIGNGGIEQNNFIITNSNHSSVAPLGRSQPCTALYHHEFEIIFSNNYPLQPPRVRCHTLYHPNVHPMTSEVCLPLLALNEWKPCFVISTILMAIDQLLTDQMHWASDWNTSRVNGEAFQLLRNNAACFNERKREYYFSRKAIIAENGGQFMSAFGKYSGSHLSNCIETETTPAEADSSSLDEMMMDDPHV